MNVFGGGRGRAGRGTFDRVRALGVFSAAVADGVPGDDTETTRRAVVRGDVILLFGYLEGSRGGAGGRLGTYCEPSLLNHTSRPGCLYV